MVVMLRWICENWNFQIESDMWMLGCMEGYELRGCKNAAVWIFTRRGRCKGLRRGCLHKEGPASLVMQLSIRLLATHTQAMCAIAERRLTSI
eukprot:1150344-Pelagomonas_calceolata.AAC.2